MHAHHGGKITDIENNVALKINATEVYKKMEVDNNINTKATEINNLIDDKIKALDNTIEEQRKDLEGKIIVNKSSISVIISSKADKKTIEQMKKKIEAGTSIKFSDETKSNQ